MSKCCEKLQNEAKMKNPERFVFLMFKVIVIHYEIILLSLIKHLWEELLLKG